MTKSEGKKINLGLNNGYENLYKILNLYARLWNLGKVAVCLRMLRKIGYQKISVIPKILST